MTPEQRKFYREFFDVLAALEGTFPNLRSAVECAELFWSIYWKLLNRDPAQPFPGPPILARDGSELTTRFWINLLAMAFANIDVSSPELMARFNENRDNVITAIRIGKEFLLELKTVISRLPAVHVFYVTVV